MVPSPSVAVDLRELAARIAGRRGQTSFDDLKSELGEHYTHDSECELSHWTWRMKYGVPVSIEAQAYRELVRMLIRRQRHERKRTAGIR